MKPRPGGERRGGVPPARRDLTLILLIVLVVDTAAAWLLVNVYYPARRKEALAEARAQLSLLARDRQNALSGWAAERLSDARLAASLLAGGADATAILDHFISAYRYESARIVDDTGTVLLRRGEPGTDDATVASFVRSPSNDSRAWIDFRRTVQREPKILTACRYIGAGGRNATVVFVSDPHDYVYPLFNTVTVASQTGETNLIGLYGDWGVGLTPYRSGSPPPMTQRVPIPREHAKRLIAQGEQSIHLVDRLGATVIGVVKTIEQTPWVVFAKINEAEVLDDAVDESVRLGQLFAFVSLMLAIIAFVILRSRRVHRLRAAQDQLARLYANTTTGILMLQVVVDGTGAPVDHQLIDMNPAAADLFGVDASEEIGKRSADAAYLQWTENIRAQNYEVALTGKSIHYDLYDAASERWYDTRCFSPRHGQFAQLLTDMTERRNFSARLLRVQDEARRRISRELHETVAQSLAGLRMNLGRLKDRNGNGRDGAEIVDDSIAIADDAITEVRTMSYLLHPPMIDQAGLATALRWYVDGFQQRSGIVTTLDVPEDLGRLSGDVETSVFRIVQESLTNVQRHSGSATARVSVQRAGEQLAIEIADRGRGLPHAVRNERNALLASGVGIAGINERVHELRGEMIIRSSDDGTTLRVTLPAS